eukprot:5750026-Heterocapsa_arctica.AAC.1
MFGKVFSSPNHSNAKAGLCFANPLSFDVKSVVLVNPVISILRVLSIAKGKLVSLSATFLFLYNTVPVPVVRIAHPYPVDASAPC